jgi:F1F0 ATPase subunit 2
VDGQRVTVPIAIRFALYLAGGAAIGALYFGSLWWNVQLFEQAGRVRTLLATMAARFALLGAVLTVVSFEGAIPLLATALGVLLARAAALRRVRVAAP